MAKLSALIKKYKGDLISVHKRSCLDLSNRVTDDTPVDTGRARQNWIANGAIRLGKIYSFTNNLPYARRLEYGWSPQARSPDGMVRKNTANWQSIVKSNL